MKKTLSKYRIEGGASAAWMSGICVNTTDYEVPNEIHIMQLLQLLIDLLLMKNVTTIGSGI